MWFVYPWIQLTLEQEPAKIASEYFTSDEMVQFRKPKKRKKVRRLKADDLLGMTAEKDDFEMRYLRSQNMHSIVYS